MARLSLSLGLAGSYDLAARYHLATLSSGVQILKTMSEFFSQVLSSDLAARYDLANMYSGLIATQAKLTQECWTDFTDAVATVLKNTVTVAW